MTKTTKILVGILAVVVVVAVTMFAANPSLLKGQMKFPTAEQSAQMTNPKVVDSLCADGPNTLYSLKFPESAQYKDFASFYNAVKNGKLKKCFNNYAVWVMNHGVNLSETVHGNLKCVGGLSVIQAADPSFTAIACHNGNSVAELSGTSGGISYSFDGTPYTGIDINSASDYKVFAWK